MVLSVQSRRCSTILKVCSGDLCFCRSPFHCLCSSSCGPFAGLLLSLLVSEGPHISHFFTYSEAFEFFIFYLRTAAPKFDTDFYL